MVPTPQTQVQREHCISFLFQEPCKFIFNLYSLRLKETQISIISSAPLFCRLSHRSGSHNHINKALLHVTQVSIISDPVTVHIWIYTAICMEETSQGKLQPCLLKGTRQIYCPSDSISFVVPPESRC